MSTYSTAQVPGTSNRPSISPWSESSRSNTMLIKGCVWLYCTVPGTCTYVPAPAVSSSSMLATPIVTMPRFCHFHGISLQHGFKLINTSLFIYMYSQRSFFAVDAKQLTMTMRRHEDNPIALVYRATFLVCILTTSIEEAAKFLAL